MYVVHEYMKTYYICFEGCFHINLVVSMLTTTVSLHFAKAAALHRRQLRQQLWRHWNLQWSRVERSLAEMGHSQTFQRTGQDRSYKLHKSGSYKSPNKCSKSMLHSIYFYFISCNSDLPTDKFQTWRSFIYSKCPPYLCHGQQLLYLEWSIDRNTNTEC